MNASENDRKNYPVRVGEMRPNQLLFNYGVGALVDLPKFAVLVRGLDQWKHVNPIFAREIKEDRLVDVINTMERHSLVEQLYAPPIPPPSPSRRATDTENLVGVPVMTYPRWMVCPRCQRLAPYDPNATSNLFELKHNPFRPGESRLVHPNCEKAKNNKAPQVVPARFLYACANGHLDEFPWMAYVHGGDRCAKGNAQLRFYETDERGQTSKLIVKCATCNESRPMSLAFDPNYKRSMPPCSGYHPHLNKHEACECEPRTVSLGASNIWFPSLKSVLSIPVSGENELAKIIEAQWQHFSKITDAGALNYLHMINAELHEHVKAYQPDEIWAAIEMQRHASAEVSDPTDIKYPEYKVLTESDRSQNFADFKTEKMDIRNSDLAQFCEQVVMVHKLREVRALVGFTRITTPDDESVEDDVRTVHLSNKPTTWLPASEVRGEGIFVQFQEQKILDWLSPSNNQAVQSRGKQFENSHQQWRANRGLDPEGVPFPGMRYLLLHSFSHALMRALALECGYSLASIRERIYARDAADGKPAMAGVLIYTAASDSEGTLGGLVRLADPKELQIFVVKALESAEFCASDPLCAETQPDMKGQTIHGAACHACSFLPETSCEMGNRYLDRSVLMPTVESGDYAFFDAMVMAG
ncbi:MAG: DrmB family protein [Candidatus Promineifilaceae bacterium]